MKFRCLFFLAMLGPLLGPHENAVAETGRTYQAATIVDEIPVPSGRGAALTSDDRFLWIARGPAVVLMDTGVGEVIEEIPVANTPNSTLALTPDDKFLLIPRGDDDCLAVLDTETLEIVSNIATGRRAHNVIVDSSGTHAYVANAYSNSVSVIDLSSLSVVKNVGVDAGPSDLALTHDGQHLLVTNAWGASLSVIRTSDHTVIHTTPISDNPVGIAVTQTHAYANVGYGDSVAVIDLSDFAVENTFPVGDYPYLGAVLSLDERYLFVGNLDRTVMVVDLEDNYNVVDVIYLNSRPWDLVMSHSGDMLYSSGYGDLVTFISLEYGCDDCDDDRICDTEDNCPTIPNPAQEDSDGDGAGDVCDICPFDVDNDIDDDGVCGDVDNCPDVPNSNQQNTDGLEDGGDACDGDDDEDGVQDTDDNCPLVFNWDQGDYDGDGEGDACDLDDDGDGVHDSLDLCLGTLPGDVVNSDGCSIADLCPCENDWKNHGAYVSCVAHASGYFVAAGLITEAEKDAIVSAAGESSCGHKNK